MLNRSYVLLSTMKEILTVGAACVAKTQTTAKIGRNMTDTFSGTKARIRLRFASRSIETLR